MTIYSGENLIVKVNLFQSDGSTPLLLSSLQSLVVKVKQTTVLATYTLGTNGQVRQGDSASQVEVEITQALSLLLKKGSVYLQIEMQVTNAEFEVDDYQKDIAVVEVFKVQ